MYAFLMDWKHPYYLHSDVMGHPCFGARKLYGLDRWKILLFLQPANQCLLFTADGLLCGLVPSVTILVNFVVYLLPTLPP